MTFLVLAAFSAYLLFYLFAAAIAPYGGQNIEVFRFFVYGPGPGWLTLLVWWILSISLRIYTFVSLNVRDKKLSRRVNRLIILMLMFLIGLELAIVIDYQDKWF
ncbi:MAG: hypothetical protein AAGG02_00795 [Cyanobacteria bacterium P01_H01_bin.15]